MFEQFFHISQPAAATFPSNVNDVGNICHRQLESLYIIRYIVYFVRI